MFSVYLKLNHSADAKAGCKRNSFTFCVLPRSELNSDQSGKKGKWFVIKRKDTQISCICEVVIYFLLHRFKQAEDLLICLCYMYVSQVFNKHI